MTEVMTEALLREEARSMQAHRDLRLKPTVQPANDGMGLFEASQGKNVSSESLGEDAKGAGASDHWMVVANLD